VRHGGHLPRTPDEQYQKTSGIFAAVLPEFKEKFGVFHTALSSKGNKRTQNPESILKPDMKWQCAGFKMFQQL
jgi:hypothetical protein